MSATSLAQPETAEISPCFDPGLGPVPTRPTPEQIDELARKHVKAQLDKIAATQAFDAVASEVEDMVQAWGIVPAGAEKSRRLNGRLAVLTVTKSDTITVNAERVETLKDMLEANDHADLFPKLFAVQTKYEIVEGAESVLKAIEVGKRLSEKVLNFFGRCITVKAKKPSVKVEIANPDKSAKKARKAKK